MELANGQRMPRVKRPRRGPPMIPKMLMTACWGREADKGEKGVKWEGRRDGGTEGEGTIPQAVLPLVRQHQPYQCIAPHRRSL